MRRRVCLVALLGVVIASTAFRASLPILRADDKGAIPKPWQFFEAAPNARCSCASCSKSKEKCRQPKSWQCPQAAWCPDDYQSKAMPCVSPTARGCKDDYVSKTMPCVPANAKGCQDDYCPKPFPVLTGKLTEPWYTCGAAPSSQQACHSRK